MIKIEDIIFWIIIFMIIGIALWLLITTNSPIEINAVISLALFVATSELLLWRAIYKINNRISIGLYKINDKLNKLEIKLAGIEEI